MQHGAGVDKSSGAGNSSYGMFDVIDQIVIASDRYKNLQMTADAARDHLILLVATLELK